MQVTRRFTVSPGEKSLNEKGLVKLSYAEFWADVLLDVSGSVYMPEAFLTTVSDMLQDWDGTHTAVELTVDDPNPTRISDSTNTHRLMKKASWIDNAFIEDNNDGTYDVRLGSDDTAVAEFNGLDFTEAFTALAAFQIGQDHQRLKKIKDDARERKSRNIFRHVFAK